jgi:hypothetical protein
MALEAATNGAETRPAAPGASVDPGLGPTPSPLHIADVLDGAVEDMPALQGASKEAGPGAAATLAEHGGPATISTEMGRGGDPSGATVGQLDGEPGDMPQPVPFDGGASILQVVTTAFDEVC